MMVFPRDSELGALEPSVVYGACVHVHAGVCVCVLCVHVHAHVRVCMCGRECACMHACVVHRHEEPDLLTAVMPRTVAPVLCHG